MKEMTQGEEKESTEVTEVLASRCDGGRCGIGGAAVTVNTRLETRSSINCLFSVQHNTYQLCCCCRLLFHSNN